MIRVGICGHSSERRNEKGERKNGKWERRDGKGEMRKEKGKMPCGAWFCLSRAECFYA
jgi:hypothetical protein